MNSLQVIVPDRKVAAGPVLFIAAILLLFQPSMVEAIIIQPSTADSYMDKWSSNSNFGDDTKLSVQSWFTSYHHRSMVRFDLSEIPQGSTIHDATLSLYLYNAYPQTRTYGVHRIDADRDWVESEVTWNSYRSGSSWSSGGGDYVTPATDTEVIGWSIGWVSWDVTGDVQFFIDNPASDNGWMIMDENEAYTPQYYKWFYSREHDSPSSRPKLDVDFDVPLPVELSYFTATVHDGAVLLSWRTESEVENLGFNIYRSGKSDGSFLKINDSLIQGAGNSPVPHDYSFVDADVQEGKRSFYYLENVDTGGRTERSETIDVFVPVASPEGTHSGELPPAFILFQNCPNPCNPSTRIPYHLPKASYVEIHIYDIAGQRVRVLEEGVKDGGAHVACWDGRDHGGRIVGSGVYFYALRAGDFSATRKLIVIR